MREESIDLRLASQDATRHTREQGIRKIAEVRGRSYGFVSNLLKESGVELRGRGGEIPLQDQEGRKEEGRGLPRG
jgi:hypothetical protein